MTELLRRLVTDQLPTTLFILGCVFFLAGNLVLLARALR